MEFGVFMFFYGFPLIVGLLAGLAAVAVLGGRRGGLYRVLEPLVLRLPRSAYASLLLGRPLDALQALLVLALHAGLAAAVAGHIVFLGVFGGWIEAGGRVVAWSMRIARVGAWLTVASSIPLLVVHAAKTVRGMPPKLCAPIGALLAFLTGATGLYQPASSLHYASVAALAVFTIYAASTSHVARGPRLLSARMLQV